MDTLNTPVNSESEQQVPIQQSFGTKTSTINIVATAVIFTLLGASAMWGYQKFSTTEVTRTISQENTVPVVTHTTVTTATPSIDSNLTLQEYTSTTNTYTFLYPQSVQWQIFATPGLKDESVAVSCESCKDVMIDLFQVTPVIFTSIEEYMQKDTLTTDKTAITLNGLPAVRGIQSGNEQAGGSFVVVFIVKDQQGYLLQQRYAGLYNKTKFSEIPQAEPDILASFKFSDK